MADEDGTEKLSPGGLNQRIRTAEKSAADGAWAAAQPEVPAPQTLEEALNRVRALLLDVRSMLHCLSEVLQYSDDNDGVMHAEVAHAAARWVNEAAADLDIAKLAPLIDAIRKRDDDSGEENAVPRELTIAGTSNYSKQIEP